MLNNYLKIALRNIRKNKTYSIINISGLAIGMACFIFAVLYIQYELSYDKYHKNGDQIYRIYLDLGTAFQGKDGVNVTPGPLVPVLKTECPEIVNGSRVFKELPEPLIKYGENSFIEKKVFYVDPDFLSMFDFPLISGNPKTALIEPNSILVTEEIAKKYFGNSNPVGKSLTINEKKQFLVTGIIKNVPKNSHFTFDFLCSFSTLYSVTDNNLDSWGANNYQSYVQLRPGAKVKDVEAKLDMITNKFKETDMKLNYKMEHIYRIHLYGDRNFEIENNGNYQYLYLFAAIGFSILLIACLNYVNISTAGSVKRSKEVGLRKVVGANRIQLVRQFLAESTIISLFGFCAAILFVEMLLPVFNSYMNTNIRLSFLSDFNMILVLLSVSLVTGCLAGVYPAFFASAFQPIYILKSGTKRGFGSIKLRDILVVIQFIISAILIFGTITVYKQLQFIKNKNLGFKKDHIVTVPLNSSDNNMLKNYKQFINELKLKPQVLGVTASDFLPFEIRSNSSANWDGKANNNPFMIYRICVDYSFLDLYGIPLINGDKSSWDRYGNKSVFLLNRTAQQALGWENPVGKQFGCDRIPKENGVIVGVAENFHYYPLHYPIQPLVLELINPQTENLDVKYFSVKIDSRNITGTLSYIEKKWKSFSDYPFDFQFLDTQVDEMYKSEQRLGQIFNLFAVLTIIIGCLGLYGLITFSIEQKIKEIGIRKVLGASVSQVTNLILKEIIICIVAANLCALPVTWYWMNKWLQNFAYRIEISWWMFALSGGIALAIALTTVSFQAVKAATTNPIESLKYE